MKKIKLTFGAIFLILTALWLTVDTFAPQPFGYFQFREVFMQYSGIIAMSAMSLCMILATRPAWIENRLHGLDKMYRLHKWLGITALCVAILHWWWAQGSKWMVGWGWIERGAKTPKPPTDSALELWLRGQRHFAESLGEWAFYAAAVLLILALLKKFPYKLFAKTHLLLAAGYLVLAFHTLVLVQYRYWTTPLGIIMLALIAYGVRSAVTVLLRRVGSTRKSDGKIVELQTFPEMKLLATTITVPQWRGHKAGQFAFLRTSENEPPHPFTIASGWDAQRGTVRFVTKALGDYTAAMAKLLKVGQKVTVEGPYGRFTFDGACRRQIWIGGGIGITPFIAGLEEMAQRRKETSDVPQVDLFFSTGEYDADLVDRLTALAQSAGAKLHVFYNKRDGYLTGDKIRETADGWQNAHLWFCGPVGFGAALRKDFAAHGISGDDVFHQELFAMR